MPSTYSDSLTTGPSLEPVSVDDARRNADLDDTYRDEDVHRWIVEGRKALEHDARVALITQTRTHELDDFPSDGGPVCLDHVTPLQSVISVAYLDSGGSSATLTEDTDFKVLAGRRQLVLKHGKSWPAVYDEPGAVTIVYVAGFGSAVADVPEAAIDAIYLWVRHRLDNPEELLEGSRTTNPFGWDSAINRLKAGVYP